MGYFSILQRNWEALANEDPLWAICTDPEKKDRKWEKVDFFQTGEQEVAAVMAHMKQHGITPDSQCPLLDFGCGVGRLTQAFVPHFDSCYGVDISSTMIRFAEEYNQYPQRCRYRVNKSPDLKIFEDIFFGFIYSSLVLQHMKPQLSIVYLKEFARILKPGGIAIVQLVDNANLTVYQRIKHYVRIRTRIIRLFEKVFVRDNRQRCVIPVYCLSEKKIRRLIQQTGLELVNVSFTNSAQKAFNGKLRYLSVPPAKGFVSKQYIFIKPHRIIG